MGHVSTSPFGRERDNPWLHAKAAEVRRQKEKERYAKNPNKKKKAQPEANPEPGAPIPVAEAGLLAGSTHSWIQKMIWVKCDGSGTPVQPLQCSLTQPSDALTPPASAPIGARQAGALPEVAIKKCYMELDPPKPSSKGSRTKPWPIKVTPLQLTDFYSFLRSHTGIGTDARDDYVRGMTRLLHMIEVDGAEITTEGSRRIRGSVDCRRGNPILPL